MKTILDTIKNKIDQIPGLKYVDDDWGQLDFYSPNFPVKWPCVLVDLGQIGFSDIGRDLTQTPINRQQGDALIVIRFANLRLSNSSTKSPRTQRDKRLEVFDLIQDIHENLQGFEPDERCGPLIRESMRRVTRDDGVQEYEIIYSAGLSDV